MRKLIFVLMAAAVYYIAGMYRQMPLMILAVMDCILIVFLLILPRCLRRKLEAGFPMQNCEAEKGSVKRCLIHIERKGVLPLKRVCIRIKVFDDRGVLLQKDKVQAVVDALAGTAEAAIHIACCGIVYVQIDSVYIYDYLCVFSAKKNFQEKLELIVLPKARRLNIRSFSEESAARLSDRSQNQPDAGRFGSENREVRQIREYRVGDTVRYVHWNQSARTGQLWIREFEREDEASFEILLDMMLPPNWKYEKRDGFYEVVSALLLGILQGRHSIRLTWYDQEPADFAAVLIENRADYRSAMRRLYRSGFVQRTEDVEKAYRKRQTGLRQKMIKCNLQLECYVINSSDHGFCKEELRHRFTYEDLEQELSGDTIFPLW